VLAWVAEHPSWPPVVYVLGWTSPFGVVSCPAGRSLMTRTGGFQLGTVEWRVGAAMGPRSAPSCCSWPPGRRWRRSFCGQGRSGPAGAWEAGFRRDAFNYLLVRDCGRFSPLSWSSAPAFLNVSIATLCLATAIGNNSGNSCLPE